MQVQEPSGRGVDRPFLETLVVQVAVFLGLSWTHKDFRGTVVRNAVVGDGDAGAGAVTCVGIPEGRSPV